MFLQRSCKPLPRIGPWVGTIVSMAMAQPKHLQLAYTPEYPIPAHPSHQLPRADQNLRNLQENIFRASKEKILTRYTMVRAPSPIPISGWLDGVSFFHREKPGCCKFRIPSVATKAPAITLEARTL